MSLTGSPNVNSSLEWTTDVNTTWSSLSYEDFNITGKNIIQQNLLELTLFLGCLAVLGFCGNVLVIVVFISKHKPSVYRTIILTLASYDTLLCCMTLPFEIYDLHNKVTFEAPEWVCKLFRTLNYFFVFNSGFTVLLMTIDRFRRVCKPLKLQMTLKVARLCIFLIFVVSVILTIPNLIIRGIQIVPLSSNLTGKDCTISDEYINSKLPTIYFTILLFLCLITISILIFLYIWIGHGIFVHFRYMKIFSSKTEHLIEQKAAHSPVCRISCVSRNVSFTEKSTAFDTAGHTSGGSILEITESKCGPKISKTGSKDIKTKDPVSKSTQSRDEKFVKLDKHGFKITKIAIAISAFYILSYIPTLVENIVEAIYGEDVLISYCSALIVDILRRTFAFNHVINPIIYGFIDEKFRKDCVSLLKFRCIK